MARPIICDRCGEKIAEDATTETGVAARPLKLYREGVERQEDKRKRDLCEPCATWVRLIIDWAFTSTSPHAGGGANEPFPG